MRERIFLILATLFWAGNYVFGKYVVAEMSPLWITFARWFLSLAFLIPISYWIERPNYREIFKRSWLPLSVMGILGIIGYNLLLYGALEYTSPLNASLVNALNPAMMVVFSYFILKERMTFINVIGFFISLVGVLLILTDGHLELVFQTSYNLGDLMMVGANLVWVFYSIIGKRLAVPPITATACSALLSVFFLLPFLFLYPFDITQLSARGITGIIYMWLFPSVCSFIFWNMSVKKVGPSHAGVYLNLITVFTAIITIILGEKIAASQAIGGVLVLFGVYFATKITKAKQNLEKIAEI
ncbi:DMT family transporter [Aeribacillus alveayuensis]|uniref:Drug/metabolite transporter (DMT)-like permease n=1 Tax=Aeribacillus alveayuensis TaxID=279215 RepID=A0ABT9VPW1_9BACI|nr:drug/metabolite transporter (DMT)-like permease [Bacillus alveayuensis]